MKTNRLSAVSVMLVIDSLLESVVMGVRPLTTLMGDEIEERIETGTVAYPDRVRESAARGIRQLRGDAIRFIAALSRIRKAVTHRLDVATEIDKDVKTEFSRLLEMGGGDDE